MKSLILSLVMVLFMFVSASAGIVVDLDNIPMGPNKHNLIKKDQNFIFDLCEIGVVEKAILSIYRARGKGVYSIHNNGNVIGVNETQFDVTDIVNSSDKTVEFSLTSDKMVKVRARLRLVLPQVETNLVWQDTELCIVDDEGNILDCMDLQGPEGIQGEPGPQGERGIDGKNGLDGLDGKPGPKGKDGKDGKPGPKGKDGKPGPKGKDGKDGRDGKPGPAGRDGKDGKQGPAGKDGLNGKQGPVGPQGPIGPQGPAGKNGKNGKNGKDGKCSCDPCDLLGICP